MRYPARTRGRLVLALVVVLALVGVFVVRLVDLQVVRAADLSEQAAGRRGVESTVYGQRGEIADTNGVALADSVMRYDLKVDPANAEDKTTRVDGEEVVTSRDELLAQIAAITGGDAAEYARTIDERLAEDPDANFANLAKNLDVDAYNAINDLGIGWVGWDTVPSRTYPLGAVAGNLVGFMGTDGAQTGLELMYDETCLGASNGTETYERSPDGVRLPGSAVTTDPAEDGGTLKLTIDSDLQWFVQQRLSEYALSLGAQWGAAAVVRVADGHIMAMADYPSVDPNDVSGVGTDALGSRAFSTPVEPGSVMKMPAAATLLDENVADPYTRVETPGSWTVNGGTINDWWPHDTIPLTLTGILMNSSNTGTSILSDQVDVQTRWQHFVDFGFGQKTAVDFSGESAGLIGSSGASWDGLTKYLVTFGQGMSATVAQIAGAYQALGNDGVKMPLTLVEGCEWADGTVTETPDATGTRVMESQSSVELRGMLESVVNEGYASSYFDIPGYNVSAKTGTGEVAIDGAYTAERTLSVAGVAPSENPEYAVVVTYYRPANSKASSSVAEPFSKIMSQVLQTYRVPTSTVDPVGYPTTW